MLAAEIITFVASLLVCEQSCSTLTIERADVDTCLDDVDDELARLYTIAMQEDLLIEVTVFPWCTPVMTSTSGMVEARP